MIRATIALFLFATAIGQTNTTIDATGAEEKFDRKVVSGISGGSDQHLPLELQTVIVNGGAQPGDSLFVDFVITNRGQEPLTLPVSLHPREIEPKDSSPSVFEHLSLFVTAGDARQPLILKGGANLYGAARLPETLRTLRPSDSLFIRARFLLTASNGTLSGPQTFTGHLSLLHETLSSKGADLESASEEVGAATSAPLSWTIASPK